MTREWLVFLAAALVLAVAVGFSTVTGSPLPGVLVGIGVLALGRARRRADR